MAASFFRSMCSSSPINEWIGVSHCLSVDAPGDYLVGMAADDQVRLKVNGALVFESPEGADGTAHWYIHRLSLNSGINIVEVLGRNLGNVGALGAEISGPFTYGALADEAQQKAADYAGNIVFSTDRLVDATFHIGEDSGYSCADEGQVVNACREPVRCTVIEHAASSFRTGPENDCEPHQRMRPNIFSVIPTKRTFFGLARCGHSGQARAGGCVHARPHVWTRHSRPTWRAESHAPTKTKNRLMQSSRLY